MDWNVLKSTDSGERLHLNRILAEIHTTITSVSLDALADVTITTPAAGQVIVRNAGNTGWENGAASGGGSGAMGYVSTATVTGSASATLTSGTLDLATDGSYEIHIRLKNNTASLFDLSFYVNGDTTAANYDYQIQSASGATTSAGRGNGAIIADVPDSADICGTITLLSDFNGKPSILVHLRAGTTTGIKVWQGAVLYRTATNVTSFTLSGSVANCLAVNSTAKVWRLG